MKSCDWGKHRSEQIAKRAQYLQKLHETHGGTFYTSADVEIGDFVRLHFGLMQHELLKPKKWIVPE